MAQFATFGYPSILKEDVGAIIFFGVLYGLSEFLAYQVLKEGEK